MGSENFFNLRKWLIHIDLTECFFFVQIVQSLVFRAFGKGPAEISTKLSTQTLG